MAERHSCKKLDLTGQRFGRLTVLGPAENIGPRTAWRCKIFEDAVKTRKQGEEDFFHMFLDEFAAAQVMAHGG